MVVNMDLNKNQKYYTEGAFLNASGTVFILSPADLDKDHSGMKENEPMAWEHFLNSHIYMVGSRPRVKFDLAKGKIDYPMFSVPAEYMLGDQVRKLTLECNMSRLQPSVAQLRYSIEDPSVIEAVHSSGIVLHHFRQTLLPSFSRQFIENPDLSINIEYVGQAYGKSGERDAVTRLQSHSTLQKILADLSAGYPNREAVVLIFHYGNANILFSMDFTRHLPVSEDEDLKRAKQIVSHTYSEKDKITIIEASLIRYFQPKYNHHYKDNYPSSDKTHLSTCYRFDFESIVTEIDTEDIGQLIHSPGREANFHHIITFPLHSDADRRSFYLGE